MFKLPLYLFFILISKNSFAQAVDSLTTSLPKVEDHEQKAQVTLQASFQNLQYFSSKSLNNSVQQKGQIEADISKIDLLKYKFHGLAGSFSTAKSAFFAVPEAYAELQTDHGRNFIAAGRKIQTLSFLDSQQNLGFMNPYFSNDYLDYRQEGLTGIHAGAQLDNFGIYAGYIPFYIPNQGPQVYAEDGKIKSSNPWAKRPPSQFSFGNQNHEIVYAIRDYNLNDIVNNPGYAASIYFGQQPVRPVVQISTSHKPVSEIALSRDTYGTATDFVGQVKLSPVVVYTQTNALDVNIDFQKSHVQTTISYLEDHPENKVAAENEALQYLEPVKVYSAWIGLDLFELIDRKANLEISYAEIFGGEIHDLMANGQPSLFTFSNQRTLFRKPFSLAFRTEAFTISNKSVETAVKWTYDRELKGTLLSGLASYQAFDHLGVSLGFDILGVEKQTPDESNFLQDNSANDRIYAGLQYVF